MRQNEVFLQITTPQLGLGGLGGAQYSTMESARVGAEEISSHRNQQRGR